MPTRGHQWHREHNTETNALFHLGDINALFCDIYILLNICEKVFTNIALEKLVDFIGF